MKYLLRNKKVEYSGTKKQLIEYVKEKYKDDFLVRENSAKFDSDFGSFKFALSCLGLELSDKMTQSLDKLIAKIKALMP